MAILKKRTIIQVTLWVALFFLMATIFYFSHQDGTGSQNTSDGLIEKIIRFMPDFMSDFFMKLNTDNKLSYIIRKGAHFTLYMLLGFISCSLCFTYFVKKIKKIFFISEMYCALYAIGDEFHQSFIPGRSAETTDVLIDCCGATFGVFLVFIFIFLLKRLKTTKN